jgi:hypothetical protein
MKKTFPLALILGLTMILMLSPGFEAFGNDQQQAEVIIIPEEVKAVFTEGKEARQARLDIPFSVEKLLYFPQMEYMHSVFWLKIKNSDLGFATPGQSEEEKKKEEETQSIFESAPSIVKARAHVFIQFEQIGGDFTKEIYIPVDMELEGSTYNADAEDMYCVGYPLLPGNYLMSLAIASPKLDKIGTQYYEFTLPANNPSAAELSLTPVFFAKRIEQMPNQESKTLLHKGFFTYAILKIEPQINNAISPGENLDVFAVILGAVPNELNQYDISVSYQVMKGEEPAIRFAAQKYYSPLISQPLPMKQTVVIKSEEGEKRESRNLEPGSYSLTVEITDNISGKTLSKTVDFEVKE